jgi:hypothetical protein
MGAVDRGRGHDARSDARPSPTEEATLLRTPVRSPFRKALLVPLVALAALAIGRGSVGAYPSDDYTGDYSAPYWAYANPAAVSRQAAAEPEPTPWFDAGAHAAGAR